MKILTFWGSRNLTLLLQSFYRKSSISGRFLPAGYPDENVYVPWVPHTARKLLTPGHRSGDPPTWSGDPPPPGQSPERFVYVYVPFPFLIFFGSAARRLSDKSGKTSQNDPFLLIGPELKVTEPTLRKSSVFPAPSKCLNFQEKGESAKICGFLRKSAFWVLSVTLVLSPQVRPDLRCNKRGCNKRGCFSRARKPWSAHCELKHWNFGG